MSQGPLVLLYQIGAVNATKKQCPCREAEACEEEIGSL